MKKLANEPVVAATVALVAATITLLIAFGVHVTADQREAIEAWVLAVIGLGVFVRAKVTPAAKVEPALQEARMGGIVAGRQAAHREIDRARPVIPAPPSSIDPGPPDTLTS